jgi:hypothetical protein
LLASLAFFAALFAFSYEIARTVRPGAAWAFTFFYLVATTSVSLSAKSPLFAIFVFMTLTLLHRPATMPELAYDDEPSPSPRDRTRQRSTSAPAGHRQPPRKFAA